MYFEIDTLSFIQKADGILQNKNALSLKKKKKRNKYTNTKYQCSKMKVVLYRSIKSDSMIE